MMESPLQSRFSRLISYFSPDYGDVCLDEDSDEEVLLDRATKLPTQPPIARDIYVCRIPLTSIVAMTVVFLLLSIAGWLSIAFFADTLGYPLVCNIAEPYTSKLCTAYIVLHAIPIVLLFVSLQVVVAVYTIYRSGGRVAALAHAAFYVLATTSIYLLLLLACVSFAQYEIIERAVPRGQLQVQLYADYLWRMMQAWVLVAFVLTATVFLKMMANQLSHSDDLVSLRRLSTAWREYNDQPTTSSARRGQGKIRLERDTKTFMRKKRLFNKRPIEPRSLGARDGKAGIIEETPATGRTDTFKNMIKDNAASDVFDTPDSQNKTTKM